jgi:2-dehydro-3-deoxyphosphogluconate aldolase/(4S)-4-hydroxy-2-oxoglutarate aldolase
MTIDSVIRRIGEIGIIPVIRAGQCQEAIRAKAICQGGIPIVEITMTKKPTRPPTSDVVRRHGSKKYWLEPARCFPPNKLAFAWTRCAQFLVSPDCQPAVISFAQTRDALAIAGALTPTELMNAQSSGARLIKIFPCWNVGGPKYLKSLKAPFPDAALIPTGGVNISNAADFILAGAFALGIGADLIDTIALRDGDLPKISRAASELVQAVQSARKALNSVA